MRPANSSRIFPTTNTVIKSTGSSAPGGVQEPPSTSKSSRKVEGPGIRRYELGREPSTFDFDRKIWTPKELEELSEYAKWHAAHPLCDSPRPAGEYAKAMSLHSQLETGDLEVDPVDPSKIYHVNRFPRLGALDYDTNIGGNAQFDEVSEVASMHENQLRLNRAEDYDDPWWNMSVRETLKLHTPKEHYDDAGSITSFIKSVDDDFKRRERAQQQLALFEQQTRQKRLDAFAISEKSWGMPQRPIKSAWAEDPRARNKYIAGHSGLLEKYDDYELENRVNAALQGYMTTAIAELKRNLEAPEPVYVPDKLDYFREKLGGETKLVEMTARWEALAVEARKLAAHDVGDDGVSNLFAMDFIEACENGAAVKAATLLQMEKASANERIGDDPVFIFIFCKILQIDLLNYPNDVELALLSDTDSSVSRKANKRINNRRSSTVAIKKAPMKDQGRKKYMKILVLLMKFKADINASGREGLTALHHAATLGNSVMTQWLLDRGADPGIHSNSVRADTPLMVAAQHGNVTTMAKLAKARANIEDCDSEGNTALHYAAMYGQTDAAVFLLRLHAKKDPMNSADMTPVDCANEEGHHSTVQAIQRFSKPIPKIAPVVDFLTKQGVGGEAKDTPMSVLDEEDVVGDPFASSDDWLEALSNYTFLLRVKMLTKFYKFLESSKKLFQKDEDSGGPSPSAVPAGVDT